MCLLPWLLIHPRKPCTRLLRNGRRETNLCDSLAIQASIFTNIPCLPPFFATYLNLSDTLCTPSIVLVHLVIVCQSLSRNAIPFFSSNMWGCCFLMAALFSSSVSLCVLFLIVSLHILTLSQSKYDNAQSSYQTTTGNCNLQDYLCKHSCQLQMLMWDVL